jgi:hypothetical protein
MTKGTPKIGSAKPVSGVPKLAEDPENYLRLSPVWRFSSFDWNGPWGISACVGSKWRDHIEGHLSSFETMTWAEILKASGGRSHGTNSHPIKLDKFSKMAREQLSALGVYADTLFSLRLAATVRIYGIRQGSCLQILWFDPFHMSGDTRAAYKW